MQDLQIRLTEGELALVIEALDSHEYWQLSESHERNDGYSTIPDGQSDDVDAVRALIAKVGHALAVKPIP